MLQFLRSLSARHEALKERIHAFRIPLSPAGQRVMGLVYFCIPVVAGYYIMQSAISQSHKNIGVNGEKLRHKSVPSNQNQALQVVLDSHNININSKKTE